MRLDETRRPARSEAILPLINVVFLLLIFLMIMGRIAERPPLEVVPAASARSGEETGTLRLFIDARGQMAFRGVVGTEAALAALEAAIAALKDPPDIVIRADAGADLNQVLRLARRVRSGTETILLEVRRR